MIRGLFNWLTKSKLDYLVQKELAHKGQVLIQIDDDCKVIAGPQYVSIQKPYHSNKT